MTLAFTEPGRRYLPEDVARAEELARRCAMAIDNARLYQRAKEAIGHRDEFLSVASHELRTPLAALQLTLQRFERAVAKSDIDEVKTRMERARRQIARLTELTEKLLDVSRIGSGKLELNVENVDLVPLVREMVERLGEAALQAGSTLTAILPDALTASCDRMRMEQVATNLLSNAIKFGSGKPIEIRLAAKDDRAELSVRDNGIGIASNKLGGVFDRFERAVSGRLYSGLGLGLYITRQIVEAHGGVVRVESQIGSGALFVVNFPLRPPPATRG
jgi:signal transduction histidine kinase